jgi:translation initiation factor 3 subunit I
MLVTCSLDALALMIHPTTFEVVKTFDNVKPCRAASISPLYDSEEHQKFHIMIGGGQEARDVTMSLQKEGGFEMKLFNIIYEEELALITGHFGPVHSIAFTPDGTGFASGSEDGYVRLHRFPLDYYSKKFD